MTNEDLWALKESSPESSPIKVSEVEARTLNEKGYGIFWSVNKFGERRRKKDLKVIRAWHVDIDKGDKKSQLRKIADGPLYPSKIIESKNGFHVYFNAIDSKPSEHREISLGLCQHFDGDPRAGLITALLRAPGYNHLKDQDAPFMVREIFSRDVSYKSAHMRYFFPYKDPKDKDIDLVSGVKDAGPYTAFITERLPTSKTLPSSSDDLTHLLNSIDNEAALKKLSGTHWVNFETYAFKEVAGGKKNIIVNGKSTSCFIDADKRIGATPGGPTLFSWLKYYGHDNKSVYRAIMELVDGRI